jgi:hypothetical protein
LPKSRSIEIAIGENGLLLVMDRPAVAKQKIIIGKMVDRVRPKAPRANALGAGNSSSVALMNMRLLAILAEPCCRGAWHRLG